MTRLLAAPVRLMNRLTYPHKFLLIGSCFALPLAVLIYFLFGEMNLSINFAHKERLGVRYLDPVQKLMGDLAAHQDLRRRTASGEAVAHVEAQIEADLLALDALDQQLDAELETGERWRAIKARWQELRARPSAPELLPAHDALLTELRALVTHVGNTSNLILDPDLDSYYLMDLAVLKLPSALQATARLRASLLATEGQGAPSAEQRAERIVLAGLLQTTLDEMDASLATAFRANPGLDPALRDDFQALRDQHERLLAETQRTLEGQDLGGSARAAEQLALAERATVAFYARTLRDLDGLLEARIGRFSARKTGVTSVTALSLLLVLGLFVAFYRSVMATVSSLRLAADRMLSGELRQPLHLENRDELGQVVRSFNIIASGLLAARDAEAESRGQLEQALRETRQLTATLEQAVADYLRFVQQVADGTLTERLSVPFEGALGQLGHGLNGMVVRLHEAQQEAERLQRTEQESRGQLEQAVADYLRFVGEVGDGNLALQLEVPYQGALGELGAGLDRMVARLRGITANVRQASTNIVSVAAQIMAATTQQAASTAEQSAAITQTTTTIEEVKQIARQTAEQATEVAGESRAALAIAREGSQAVEQSVVGMFQIRGRVDSIAETIVSLAAQTQAINTIILTVSELADQSNLLALNAAIEAARAGAHGKSFGVVAQHVRDLAERSKRATVQVRQLLGEIQGATSAAVSATDEGRRGVERGVSLSEQAGMVIYRMAGEVETSAMANQQMAAAAQQQTIGMDQIGDAMLSIQEATYQTLASTRQAESAARELEALAGSLQQAVAAYAV